MNVVYGSTGVCMKGRSTLMILEFISGRHAVEVRVPAVWLNELSSISQYFVPILSKT